jgi:cytosine/adenosine deaminase-related metal-dependent hydrolase
MSGPIGQLVPGLAPHAPYTISEQHLEQTLALAARLDAPLTMHAAESPDEVAFVSSATGPLADILYPLAGWEDDLPQPQHCSPIAWLVQQQALRPGMLLVHGVQVDEADVEQIASAGCGMVLCPRSNQRLGVGTAPVGLYRRHGVQMALGTDSLASNDSLSLWDEIAAARRLYPEIPPGELLHIATAGGADCLGLKGELGRLVPGSGAHFQLLRPSSLPPGAELEDFLTSGGRSAEVAQLWLAGQELLAK